MPITAFPDVNTADQDGLLAIGGDLAVESLLLAYSNGIFPWPFNEQTLAWFAPPKRAVLFFSDYHISKSLKRIQRNSNFTFAINKNFSAVIMACSEPINRGKQTGTWITPTMIAAYCQLHEAGYAHSFECYQNNELVGGLYGVGINALFAAESMFYRKSNASKLVLWLLVDYLKSFAVSWIDVQIPNRHLETIGVNVITRNDYMLLLDTALKWPIKPFEQQHIEHAVSALQNNWDII